MLAKRADPPDELPRYVQRPAERRIDPNAERHMKRQPIKRIALAVLQAGIVIYCVYDFVRTTYSANTGGGPGGPDHWYCSPWFYAIAAVLNTLLSFGCLSLCNRGGGTEEEIADCRLGCFGWWATITFLLYLFWEEMCQAPTL